MSIPRTHMLESVCFIRKSAISVHYQWSCTSLKPEASVSLTGLLLSTLVKKSSGEVDYILKRQHERSQLLSFLFGLGEDSF